jgi:hypothetical protein
MKRIGNLKIYNYHLKSKRIKIHNFKKIHVSAYINDNIYNYNRYIENINSNNIEKVMKSYRYSEETILSILSNNDLEVINKFDNKKTLKYFKDKVKLLDDCKVFALPSNSDRFRLAYEFSKIENSKKKIR